MQLEGVLLIQLVLDLIPTVDRDSYKRVSIPSSQTYAREKKVSQ